MHIIKNKRGQSTVEYILLVTAVVAVMIVFATNQNGGIQGQLGSVLNTSANGMNSEMVELDGSHTTSGPSNTPAPVSFNPGAGLPASSTTGAQTTGSPTGG